MKPYDHTQRDGWDESWDVCPPPVFHPQFRIHPVIGPSCPIRPDCPPRRTSDEER